MERFDFRPLFFNLFIIFFFFFERTNICNFADDNTIYNCNILKRFKVNSVKPNSKKFQSMILGKSSRPSIILNIDDINLREYSSVVLLGLTIDNQVTFNNHIKVNEPRYKQCGVTHTFRKLKNVCRKFCWSGECANKW